MHSANSNSEYMPGKKLAEISSIDRNPLMQPEILLYSQNLHLRVDGRNLQAGEGVEGEKQGRSQVMAVWNLLHPRDRANIAD